MKILSLALLAALSSTAAHAETFSCLFTEPFVEITYNTATGKLLVQDAVAKTEKKLINVDFKILGAGEFSLISNKKEVARLALDHKGSDGMSDNVFPYSVKTTLVGGASSGIGGCSSSALPVKESDGN